MRIQGDSTLKTKSLQDVAVVQSGDHVHLVTDQ